MMSALAPILLWLLLILGAFWALAPTSNRMRSGHSVLPAVRVEEELSPRAQAIRDQLLSWASETEPEQPWD